MKWPNYKCNACCKLYCRRRLRTTGQGHTTVHTRPPRRERPSLLVLVAPRTVSDRARQLRRLFLALLLLPRTEPLDKADYHDDANEDGEAESERTDGVECDVIAVSNVNAYNRHDNQLQKNMIMITITITIIITITITITIPITITITITIRLRLWFRVVRQWFLILIQICQTRIARLRTVSVGFVLLNCFAIGPPAN